MSKRFTVLAVAMAILVTAMGLKSAVTSKDSSAVLMANAASLLTLAYLRGLARWRNSVH